MASTASIVNNIGSSTQCLSTTGSRGAMPVSGSTERRTENTFVTLPPATSTPPATHSAIRFQARKVVAHIILQVRRDGALAERLAGGALVLRQHLPVGHLRWIVDT